MAAQGAHVISLGAGEPDFPTPDSVKEAGIDAIRSDMTRYTAVAGTAELKEAIRHKFKRDNNLTYTDDEVIVGVGGKQVLYNAFMATLDVGDEVIIPAPYWVSYPDMVKLAGGTPVIVSCGEEQGFKLSPAMVRQAMTERTKWLVLNSPGNPSGAVYSRQELQALANVLKDAPHVWVMSDDMYEHIVYASDVFATMASVDPAMKPRVLTVNGVSKAYSMTGWRIGFAGGDRHVIGAMAKIQSQSTSNPCSISQHAAAQALLGEQHFLVERNERFRERRDYVVNFLNDVEGLSCRMPEGAFYVFVCCRPLLGKGGIKSDIDFADYILSEEKVALVAGTAFGCEGYFRVSYATSLELLQEACRRIKRACERLRKA